MSASFIGCKISLISKSEIRYEGILYTIDTKESTIALAKVRSFGTEDRVTDKPVAPRNEVYEYIIFRASDIKDLLVDDPPASSPGLTDPAIIQAQSGSSSGGPPPTSFPAPKAAPAVSAAVPKTTLSNVLASVAAPSPPKKQQPPAGHQEERPAVQKPAPQRRDQPQQQQHSQYQPHERRQPQAAEKNTGRENRDFRSSQQQENWHRDGQQRQQNRNFGNQTGQRRVQSDWPTGGNRRDGGQGGQVNRQPRPRMLDVRKLEEYDFEKANAEFEELAKNVEDMKVADAEKSEAAPESTAETEAETYNKTKSFFDSISCEAIERAKGNSNRVDRRQERKMNQETFGVSSVYNNRWGYSRGGGGFRGGRGGGGYRGHYQNRGFGRQTQGYGNRPNLTRNEAN